MAYRRRQGISRASTFKEEIHSSLDDDPKDSHQQNGSTPSLSSSNSPSPSLAAQAIKASAARRQPALSFAFDSSHPDHQRSTNFDAYGNDNNKTGFWGVLAHKAKSILDESNSDPPLQHDTKPQTVKSHSFNTFSSPFSTQPFYQPPDSNKRMDNASVRKGLDAITTSLNHLGDTFEKAYEDGKTMVESKTADLRSQIRRKGDTNQASSIRNPWQQSDQTQSHSNHETQLKQSRDVRWHWQQQQKQNYFFVS
ncbi:hypothetical protein RYX36_029978 [Vicia faba]